jgi:hypothetical protein
MLGVVKLKAIVLIIVIIVIFRVLMMSFQCVLYHYAN